MILYRTESERVHTPAVLDRIRGLSNRLDDHDAVVELLIEYCGMESAVADALHPCHDGSSALSIALRHAALALGHLFHDSWLRMPEPASRTSHPWLALFRRRLEEAVEWGLPRELDLSVPEGFAQYGLYPETYLQAALRFREEADPVEATVVGLRSIGTGLSAVVAAALEERGCRVRSYTLRPRGHPFDRRIDVALDLARRLARSSGHFLVVDEGPGLSGSSFTAAAECLSELGVADERIVFFPSWPASGSGLFSARARARWPGHALYTSDFEDIRTRVLPCTDHEAVNLSAGAWRNLLYTGEAQRPAAQPQHERRKYLHPGTPGGSADAFGPDAVLYKFAGLGRFGRAKLERAHLLAEAGFSPPALGLSRGFLAHRFVPGTPCAAEAARDEATVGRLADYLAFVRIAWPVSRPLPARPLLEMIRTNVGEGLGPAWLERLGSLEHWHGLLADSEVTAIDGRMFPHEWIRSGGTLLKTDAVDHHADHMFPGSQDIAWDLAATALEFRLGRAEREFLLDRYARSAADPGIRARMPFYTVAYLAFRLGYALTAARALSDSADAVRFRTVAASAAARLRFEIRRREAERVRIQRCRWPRIGPVSEEAPA